MPSKSQVVSVPGHEPSDILPVCYHTFQQLGWTVKFAGEKALVGYTPKSWKKYDEEISIRAESNQYTITSKMIHGESFDMMGKNQKHINEFVAAFEKVKAGSTDTDRSNWQGRIEELKKETVKIAAEQEAMTKEVDKVMNLTKGNMYATYAIIGINVLVFIAMVAAGNDFMNPTPEAIFNWGGNLTYVTVNGEAWRLLTNTFVHIGFLHLLFNMYGLYFVGSQLEPMLGKTRYVVAYLATGILASVASLWWHRTENIVSAGASGAIFGLFGLFLALLTTKLIPEYVRKSMMQSTAIFVGYNLFYGLKGGVDNSAHIGGLLSGMLIGYLFYFFGLKNRDIETGKGKNTISSIVVIGTIVISFLVLQSVRALFVQ